MPASTDTEGMEVKVNKTSIIIILIAITVDHLDSYTVPGKHSLLYQFKYLSNCACACVCIIKYVYTHICYTYTSMHIIIFHDNTFVGNLCPQIII